MPWQLPTDLVNETQGTFWSLLLACFCFVLFMASVKYGQERATGYGGIAGLFGALILATLNLMSWWIASIFIIVGTLGLTYMIMNR